jgi:hypothetical protein
VAVHSVLPESLTAVVDEVLAAAEVPHVPHGVGDPLAAGEAAAMDASALALIGPFRSADVAEVVEATAPVGLPLLAPLATWARVTRDDEPGCEDPARHLGTVLRLVARDTVVAERIAGVVREGGRRALVVAGDHEYGRQLDGQLSLADLPRARDDSEADLVILAGLEDGPEIGRAASCAPLPVIAFDGIQGADWDTAHPLSLALPIAPQADVPLESLLAGAECARRAAQLVASALAAGARERGALLEELRARGPFDRHGDPIDPPVWLWQVRDGWALEPDRSI